jgi:ABC-2 type transport system permease protein
MNTQSHALNDSPIESHAGATAMIPASQRFYWSVRRELWESRSIYIAPLIVGGLIVFAFLIGTFHQPGKLRAALGLDGIQQQRAIEQPYHLAALLLMGTTFIVALFYCLDALHGERRDRSILFWKSLPVSDLTTVLSKFAIPLFILPLVTFAITMVTQGIMLLLSMAFARGSGLSVATLWNGVPLFQMSLLLFYHLMALHGLFYAPIYGWLLLVSGWARRAAVLWAALPLVAIGVIEKIAFNSTRFATMMGTRIGGGLEGSSYPGSNNLPVNAVHIHPGSFLFSADLWIGLVLAAIFIAAAVRLRRYQGPI